MIDVVFSVFRRLISGISRLLRSTALLASGIHAIAADAQEVVVLPGVDAAIEWLQAEDWWGEEDRSQHLDVPRMLITGINPEWRETSQALTVADKKEVFYRFMLPLIVHANVMVLDRRARLIGLRERLEVGDPVSPDELEFLRAATVLLRVTTADEAAALTADDPALSGFVDELLYRLDVIPAGLALGQAAYESGYGTSRFTIEGNAFFGQWSYGGKGLVPEQQRQALGDHRIAAYDWPFDSVRGYFLNLSSHPAYEEFRRLRAELRAEGKPLDSLALADGLFNYSERGQEYVDTLKGVIRVNSLAIADGAVPRDEPLRFVIGAPDEATAAEIRDEIESMRETGALAGILDRMQLD